MTKDRTAFSDNTRPSKAPSSGNNRSTGNSNCNTALRQRRPFCQQNKNIKGKGSSEKAKHEAKAEATDETTSEVITPVKGTRKAEGTPRVKSQGKQAFESKSGDDKFSGSSFYLSPNAASLPRPPFSKPPSPPQAQMQPQPPNISPPLPMNYPPFMAYPPTMQLGFNRAPMMYPSGHMGYPMGPPHSMAPPTPKPVGPYPMYAPPPVAIRMQQPSAN